MISKLDRESFSNSEFHLKFSSNKPETDVRGDWIIKPLTGYLDAQ